MAPWGALDILVQNMALLTAGTMVIGLTFRPEAKDQTLPWLALRYLAAVLLGMYLTSKGLVLFGDLRFDFRAVIIAIVARRHGAVPALLVVLPLSLYRLGLGGSGVGWGLLEMTLIATLGALGTGWLRLDLTFDEVPRSRRWWWAFQLFAAANLTVVPAALLTGQSLLQGLALYALTTVLGTLGTFMAYEILQARLQNLVHTSHLTRLAAVDSLTGCFNRRQFDADFMAPPASQPTFLLMLDLDHFKRINDTYGHDTGDRVLVALAETLRATTRSTDCLYRLGGEEFAVLLHGGTLKDAQEVAERIRHTVDTTLAAHAGLVDERITLSGGLVRVQGERHQVLRAADRHLYAAKRAGRNQIHMPPITRKKALTRFNL